MNMFQGCHVALATPFTADQEVDFEGFRRLVRFIAPHVDQLIVLGSTGEAATVLDRERDSLVEACLEEAGSTPVLVGTGHNATQQAAQWTKRAQAMGAHGALVVTPYYNKPTAEGVFQHFRYIAHSAPNFPLIAYNVPGRTGLNLSPATVERLWSISEVVGLKESSGNLVQIAEIARSLPAGKTLLAGDDVHALASIALGAQGLVSVMANLFPQASKQLVAAASNGLLPEALQLHRALAGLMEGLFVETNPIPLKAGLAHLGLCEAHLRLPLTTALPSTHLHMAQLLTSTHHQLLACAEV